MPQIFQKLNAALASLAIVCIRGYQATISPTHGMFRNIRPVKVCIHEPDCSSYTVDALRRYGFVQGMHMGLERISQCTPANEHTYDPTHYRVVFASGSPIGVPFLQTLVQDKRFEVVGVMTAEDKPSGRGQQLKPNIIKTTALTHLSEEQILTPRSLRLSSKKYADDAMQAKTRLTSLKPDFLVVVAYGKILPQHILDIPTIGPVNVHGSLLPEYRGASPLQSVFLDNKEYSGITIMKMEAGLDTGPMIDKLKTRLYREWTVNDLIDWMKSEGPKFLNTTMRKWGKGRLALKEQNDSLSTHCSKIEKEDGLIDPYNDTLQDIYARYRAFALRPKIYWEHEEKRILIEKLLIDRTSNLSAPLLSAENKLHTGVQELRIKPEGKKAMSRQDYLNGLK